MDRRIPRRDFLNGIALGVAGASLAPSAWPLAARTQAPAGEPAYPPQRLGLRGQHASSIESFAAIRRGDFAAAYPSIDTDTDETYDLVIVGGGLSGLAAAYFWHKGLPNQRVLILDNHDDFGGHAKRNEFVYGGPHLPGLRRHDERGHAVSLQLHGQAAAGGSRRRRAAQRRVPEPHAVREVPAGRRDLLRQGTLRRGPAGGRHRPAVVARVLRQGAAQRGGPPRSRAPLRQEPRLPARQDRRAEAGAAGPHQPPGVPADAREDEPRRPAVLPRAGWPQQQARGHDPGAGSGAGRPDRLRRARAARRGVVPAGQLHVPLPRRQRVDRPAPGVAARAQGDSRHATTWRRS